MEYNNIKVVDLKALVKERGLPDYSKLKKAELITFLQNNLQPTRTRPSPLPSWEPIDDKLSVRFRPIGQDKM